jgi:uncharacterized RDD family membrane protein YckC
MSSLPPPPSGPPPPPPGYTNYGDHVRPGAQAALAGFWIRFLAVIVDGIILSIPTGILTAMIDDRAYFSVGAGARPGATIAANVLSTLIGVVYYAMLEGGPTGQTLGKRICGIRVVDATTGQPGVGLGRGVGRYFARWLSSLPLGLGYFWMLWDERKQTWHDKLVSTLVVKV